jgi:hypothetical protein
VPEGDEEDPDSEAQLRAQMAFLPPRHVFPTIGDLLCPRFTPISFIFLVSVLDIAMFVTALAGIVAAVSKYVSWGFLMSHIGLVCFAVGATKYDGAFVAGNDMGGPSGTTFMSLGAKLYAYSDCRIHLQYIDVVFFLLLSFFSSLPYIKAGQVHRLLAAVFLHGGIMHLAANLFFQVSLHLPSF